VVGEDQREMLVGAPVCKKGDKLPEVEGTEVFSGALALVQRCFAFLSLTLLSFANLQECYGSKHPEKVAKVKELYDILGLPSTYKIYEEQTYALLSTQIQQITRGLPHKLFFKFLQKVYVKDAYISRPIR
jgi:hypothetical protein